MGNRKKLGFVTAWQFSDSPNYLARLVIDELKNAICPSHIYYELETKPISPNNDYSFIFNAYDEPISIIKTSEYNVRL